MGTLTALWLEHVRPRQELMGRVMENLALDVPKAARVENGDAFLQPGLSILLVLKTPSAETGAWKRQNGCLQFFACDDNFRHVGEKAEAAAKCVI